MRPLEVSWQCSSSTLTPSSTFPSSPLFYSQMKDYLQTDLLPMIYSAGDQDQMMEESQQAAQRREEMIRMYHTCKDALTLISEVSTKTGRYLVRFQVHGRLGMRPAGLVLCAFYGAKCMWPYFSISLYTFPSLSAHSSTTSCPNG